MTLPYSFRIKIFRTFAFVEVCLLFPDLTCLFVDVLKLMLVSFGTLLIPEWQKAGCDMTSELRVSSLRSQNNTKQEVYEVCEFVILI